MFEAYILIHVNLHHQTGGNLQMLQFQILSEKDGC